MCLNNKQNLLGRQISTGYAYTQFLGSGEILTMPLSSYPRSYRKAENWSHGVLSSFWVSLRFGCYEEPSMTEPTEARMWPHRV